MTPTRRDFLLTTAGTLATGLTSKANAQSQSTNVVVWDERQPAQKQAYKNFLGNAIADHLGTQPGLSVKSVALDDPNQGLSEDILGPAKVLVWWGHVRQAEVKPEVGKAIVERIKAGTLSLIALHSAHWATPFVEAMNERARIDLAKAHPSEKPLDVKEIAPNPRYNVPKHEARLTPYARAYKYQSGSEKYDLHLPLCVFPDYRNDGKPSTLNVLKKDHPIVAGVPASFEIPHEEMYNEPFHVPRPDEVILEERFSNGEWFRAGMVWKLGKGRVFYFRPGHETYPTYTQEIPLRIVANAVKWLASNPA